MNWDTASFILGAVAMVWIQAAFDRACFKYNWEKWRWDEFKKGGK